MVAKRVKVLVLGIAVLMVVVVLSLILIPKIWKSAPELKKETAKTEAAKTTDSPALKKPDAVPPRVVEETTAPARVAPPPVIPASAPEGVRTAEKPMARKVVGKAVRPNVALSAPTRVFVSSWLSDEVKWIVVRALRNAGYTVVSRHSEAQLVLALRTRTEGVHYCCTAFLYNDREKGQVVGQGRGEDEFLVFSATNREGRMFWF